MTLNEIYNYITETYPYYKTAGNGWKVCACVCKGRYIHQKGAW